MVLTFIGRETACDTTFPYEVLGMVLNEMVQEVNIRFDNYQPRKHEHLKIVILPVSHMYNVTRFTHMLDR